LSKTKRAEGGRMYLDVLGCTWMLMVHIPIRVLPSASVEVDPTDHAIARNTSETHLFGSKSAGLGRLKRGLHREGVCPCILHPASCSLLSKSAGSWFRACVYIRQKSINARSILSIKPRPIHNVSQSRRKICSPDDTISLLYQLQDAL
jgi:hypothetical protein